MIGEMIEELNRLLERNMGLGPEAFGRIKESTYLIVQMLEGRAEAEKMIIFGMAMDMTFGDQSTRCISEIYDSMHMVDDKVGPWEG